MSFSLLVFVTYYGSNSASGQTDDEIGPDSEFITDSNIISNGSVLTLKLCESTTAANTRRFCSNRHNKLCYVRAP